MTLSSAVLLLSGLPLAAQVSLQSGVSKDFSVSTSVPTKCRPSSPNQRVTCRVMFSPYWTMTVPEGSALLDLVSESSAYYPASLRIYGRFGSPPTLDTYDFALWSQDQLTLVRTGDEKSLLYGIYYAAPVLEFDVTTTTFGTMGGQGKVTATWGGGPAISAQRIVNAASFDNFLSVAPGTIVSLFGVELGPVTPAYLELTPDSRAVTRSAGGTRVRFNGIEAPILYSSYRQVNAIVPFSIDPTCQYTGGWSCTETVTVEVERDGVRSNRVKISLMPWGPEIFTRDGSGKGQAAALNEDYRVNSASNPAARGSVLMLYVTGAGRMSPAVDDGVIVGSVTPRATAEIKANIGGRDAEVLYVGAATGLVAGVFQINVRVPPAVQPGSAIPVFLYTGNPGWNWNRSEDGVTVAIR